MKNASLMVCKGLLSKCPDQMRKDLMSLIPKLEQGEMARLPEPAPYDSKKLHWNILEHLHSSWLAPQLRTLSSSEIALFLAALPSEKRKALQNKLGFQNDLPHLSHIAKDFARAQILKFVMQGADPTPVAFLPEHPLSYLLDLSSAKLGKLARYLGLHDLSAQMRQIISTAQLKKVFAGLTPKEGEYLNQLLPHKEPLIFESLFLGKWDESKSQLHKLIDERGMNRLGCALYHAHDDFIWYLTHLFEIHQGALLIKYRQEKPAHERAEKLLNKQIEEALQYIDHGDDES